MSTAASPTGLMAAEFPKRALNPTDGWKAFVVAFAASMLQAISLGISNSYSIFSKSMQNDEGLGRPSSTQISLPSSVSTGLGPLITISAGLIVARFGTRVTSLISASAVGLAVLVSALAAESIATMVVTYGILMGISAAFMISPGATATSTWFVKRKALGMGICFTGGGTGSVIIPRIAGALAESYSWRTSFLILSSLSSISIIAALFVCMRPDDADDDEDVDDGNDQELNATIGPREADAAGLPTATAALDKPQFDLRSIASPTGLGQSRGGLTSFGAGEPDPSVSEIDGSTAPLVGAPAIGNGGAMVIIGSPLPEESPAASREPFAGEDHADATIVLPEAPSGAAVVPAAAVIVDVVAVVQRPFNLHTEKADVRRLVCEVLCTRAFVGLFLAVVCFSFGFYGNLYMAVPYALDMGKANTVYAAAEKIPIGRATLVFIPFGAVRIIGGPVFGSIAVRFGERQVFVTLLLLQAVFMGCYSLAREFWHHMLLMTLLGSGISGFYSTYSSMVGQRFFGPNLPVVMSVAFFGTVTGGFGGAPIVTAITANNGGDYTSATIFMAAFYGASALSILLLVGPPPPQTVPVTSKRSSKAASPR